MDAVASALLADLGEVTAASAQRPYDAVVVGGGSTGLTTARVLAEGGHRVAVLEAGPLALLTHASSTDLRFSPGAVRGLQQRLSYSPMTADGKPFGALVSCLGGRGMFWNGAAPRYLDADFADWPFDATELAADYRWAEEQLFVSRSWGRTRLARSLSKRLRDHGLPSEPEPFAIASGPSINGHLTGTIGNGVTLLLRSGLFGAEQPPNRPRIAANARVLRVDRHPGEDVVAVSVVGAANEPPGTVLARSVVLAAGGFESVRLALVSGLQDESGKLGTNLSDHWFVRAYFPLPVGFYDSVVPEAGALIVRPGAERAYQIELHVPGRRFFTAEAPWAPAPTDEYSVMVRAFAPVRGRTGTRIEALPGSDAGQYLVHVSPSSEDANLVTSMRDGLEAVRAALGAAEATIDALPSGASYHEAGGLQMGTTPAAGVVDSFGRSWADPRVRVFDAAAWPSISAANPHLTLVAVAHRQATRLAADLAAG